MTPEQLEKAKSLEKAIEQEKIKLAYIDEGLKADDPSLSIGRRAFHDVEILSGNEATPVVQWVRLLVIGRITDLEKELAIL